MLGDWQEGMVTLYSTEALVPRKMELLTRLLGDVEAVLGFASERGIELPAVGGWGDMGQHLASALGKGKAKRLKSLGAVLDIDGIGRLPHEDSSSGSDSDAD